jgi:hypothetical protein
MRGSFDVLVDILLLKNFSDATRSLLDDHLKNTIAEHGIDGRLTAQANYLSERFHQEIVDTLPTTGNRFLNMDSKAEHFRKAASFCKRASQLFVKYYDPKHPVLIKLQKKVGLLSTKLR